MVELQGMEMMEESEEEIGNQDENDMELRGVGPYGHSQWLYMFP